MKITTMGEIELGDRISFINKLGKKKVFQVIKKIITATNDNEWSFYRPGGISGPETLCFNMCFMVDGKIFNHRFTPDYRVYKH